MRFLLFLVSLFFCFQCKAQSNVFFIGSCSLDLSSDSVYASVSIGESVVSTLKQSNNFVSQGFLQADPNNTIGLESKWTGTETIVYPNPFDKQIQISSNLEFNAFCLYDCFGKLIESNTFSPIMNLEHLNASTYLLVLYSENNQVIRSFKIVKLY